ncbi:hypothetical protein AAVH_27696 [Aphelenchoides avenae]|nr:hypothetical protein AAVH_27696 [Aphelenchus avenae]
MKRLVCGINVRHWILFVSFLAITSLFANLVLYNFVAIHSDELLPVPFRANKSRIRKSHHEVLSKRRSF